MNSIRIERERARERESASERHDPSSMCGGVCKIHVCEFVKRERERARERESPS